MQERKTGKELNMKERNKHMYRKKRFNLKRNGLNNVKDENDEKSTNVNVMLQREKEV